MLNSPENLPPTYDAMQPTEGYMWQIPTSELHRFGLEGVLKFLEERDIVCFEAYGQQWPEMRPLAEFNNLFPKNSFPNIIHALKEKFSNTKQPDQKAPLYDGTPPPPQPPGNPPDCDCNKGKKYNGTLGDCAADGTKPIIVGKNDNPVWLPSFMLSGQVLDSGLSAQPLQAVWKNFNTQIPGQQDSGFYGYACQSAEIYVWASGLDPTVEIDGTIVNGLSLNAAVNNTAEGSQPVSTETPAPKVVVILVTPTQMPPSETPVQTDTTTPAPTDTQVPTPTRTPRPPVPLREILSEGNMILYCSYAIIPVGIIIFGIIIGTQASSLAHEGLDGVRQRISKAKENKHRTSSLQVQRAQYEQKRR
jgi:hypothetical protein